MATLTPVERWSGPGRRDATIVPLSPAGNGAHPSDHELAFEHWYFDARLDSGHIVVGFLQTRELIARKPGVELHVYDPDGTHRKIVRTYRPAQCRASDEYFDVRIGDNWGRVEHPEATGLPVHRLHLAEDDVEFDLEFANEVAGWRGGDGDARWGNEVFFAWAVGAPRATVSGTVRIGDTVLDATGRGYHDHNWGVGDMKRVVAEWFWGRVSVGELTVVYASVHSTPAYGDAWINPVMAAVGPQIVLSTGESTVTTGPRRFDPRANRDYPTSLAISSPGEIDVTITVRDVVDAHDYLAEVPVLGWPGVKSVANRLLGRPGYFRFRSDVELTVLHGGETLHRTGECLHEMVALR